MKQFDEEQIEFILAAICTSLTVYSELFLGQDLMPKYKHIMVHAKKTFDLSLQAHHDYDILLKEKSNGY